MQSNLNLKSKIIFNNGIQNIVSNQILDKLKLAVVKEHFQKLEILNQIVVQTSTFKSILTN